MHDRDFFFLAFFNECIYISFESFNVSAIILLSVVMALAQLADELPRGIQIYFQ
jgi:hypothetical protein